MSSGQPPDGVDTTGAGDGESPSAEARRISFEAADASGHIQEHVAQHILGIRAAAPAEESQDVGGEPPVERVPGPLVTTARPSEHAGKVVGRPS